MTIYILLEFQQGSFSKVLGVFSTYEEAKEAEEKDFNIWANEPRKIVEQVFEFDKKRRNKNGRN